MEKENKIVDHAIASFVLSKSNWTDRPDLVEKIISRGNFESAWEILSQPHWSIYPYLFEKLLRHSDLTERYALIFLNNTHWKKHPNYDYFLNIINSK